MYGQDTAKTLALFQKTVVGELPCLCIGKVIKYSFAIFEGCKQAEKVCIRVALRLETYLKDVRFGKVASDVETNKNTRFAPLLFCQYLVAVV